MVVVLVVVVVDVTITAFGMAYPVKRHQLVVTTPDDMVTCRSLEYAMGYISGLCKLSAVLVLVLAILIGSLVRFGVVDSLHTGRSP